MVNAEQTGFFVCRLGYHDYTVIDNVFEMVIPSASAAELAGPEGRSP